MSVKKTAFWFLAAVFLGGILYLAYDRMMDLMPPEVRQVGILLSGNGISAGKAAELEAKVQGDPEDMKDRETLLGYYFMRQYGSPDIQKARDAHIDWFIQNHPDSSMAGMPYAQIESVSDPGYGQAAQLWQEQVLKNPGNPQVIKNAAAFFTLTDKPTSEGLLLKGAALEPSAQYWPDQLGHLYSLERDYPRALEQYEKAYGLALGGSGQLSVLPDLSKTSVKAGDLVKAEKYAQELLDKAENSSFDWNKGEDLHDANMVLGQVALRSGDLEAAKQYLLKAGRAPGSNHYSSFGPNMSLANDLLEKGETDTVLQYFDLCSKFWDDGGKLAQWTSAVKEGKIPDFAGNLDY